MPNFRLLTGTRDPTSTMPLCKISPVRSRSAILSSVIAIAGSSHGIERTFSSNFSRVASLVVE